MLGKRNSKNSVGGTDWGENMIYLKRILKYIGIFIVGVVVLIVLISLSPKESVRVRIAFAGHPALAVKCNPKLEKGYRDPHYLIPYKQAYLSDDGSYMVNEFAVKRILVFHYAKQVVPIL